MTRLEYLRRMQGWTQARLAAESRVDRSYVSRAEKHRFCYLSQLRRMADALGYAGGDPAKLLEEVNDD